MKNLGATYLGEGIWYHRRTDGFTLTANGIDIDRHGCSKIHMTDELFESLAVLQQRNRRTHDPSLDVVDGDGYAEGGEA